MAGFRRQVIPISDIGLSIVFQIPSGGLYDKLAAKVGGDRWGNIIRVLRRYYSEMAYEINFLAAEMFEEGRKRPNVSTGRLVNALIDDRNAFISDDSFFVGVPSFMDHSRAKYWRQIDQGTTVHLGQYLFGVWGSSLSGGRATGATGEYFLAGPAYTMHKNNGGGDKFQPASTFAGGKIERPRMKQGKHFRGQTATRGQARPSAAFISKPITAEHYYHRAYLKYTRTNRPLNLFRAVVAKELGLQTREVGRSWDAIIDQL